MSTLKLVRKHRPFAENDNLPKICQPEDHIEVSSPHSSSNEEEDEELDFDKIDADSQDAKARHQEKEAIRVDNKFGDSGPADHAELLAAQAAAGLGPEMGPNCNLRSIFQSEQNGASNLNV